MMLKFSRNASCVKLFKHFSIGISEFQDYSVFSALKQTAAKFDTKSNDIEMVKTSIYYLTSPKTNTTFNEKALIKGFTDLFVYKGSKELDNSTFLELYTSYNKLYLKKLNKLSNTGS